MVGDLNEDLFIQSYHNLKDLMYINSMHNVVTEPTRANALLDPIIIPLDLPYLHTETIEVPSYISDHKSTNLIIPCFYDINPSFERNIWLSAVYAVFPA